MVQRLQHTRISLSYKAPDCFTRPFHVHQSLFVMNAGAEYVFLR
jgi:hypothetical protein